MKNITGVMVYYYFVCKRKLWYFNKDINMEFNSELVGIGKLIDENSYSRNKKSILIDETVNIDFLEDWNVIHEVKKSRKVDIAAKWQLKYYIWTLRNKGINIEKGVLDYPILRKREEVFLNRQEEEELLCVLDDIRNTINLDKPPETADKRICKKCSYYELCYV